MAEDLMRLILHVHLLTDWRVILLEVTYSTPPSKFMPLSLQVES